MYNFKKTSKLYIVENNVQYPIEIYPDISVSQTFNESSQSKKTLHKLTDLHEGATITTANPANFSFTSPINGQGILIRLGTYYSAKAELVSFDIYLELDSVIYKIEGCVVETLVFNIERSAICTLSVSGTGKIISTVSNVPGIPVPYIASNYLIIGRSDVVINNTFSMDSVASIHIEYTNSVTWVPNNTLQQSLAGGINYPGSYVLTGRRVSGSVTEFLKDTNLDQIGDYSTNTKMTITIGNESLPQTIIFKLPSVVYTRRLNIDDLINRVYDFRVNTNSGVLAPILVQSLIVYDSFGNIIENRDGTDVMTRGVELTTDYLLDRYDFYIEDRFNNYIEVRGV